MTTFARRLWNIWRCPASWSWKPSCPKMIASATASSSAAHGYERRTTKRAREAASSVILQTMERA
jgi:hypothetical protein